jgi:uroporphyrinogen-III synthase
MPTIPVLLLKTRSTPEDAYEELFSSQIIEPRGGKHTLHFEPQFVPVLQHRFLDAGLDTVRSHLQSQEISRREGAKYGGMIFTSQRAVEALTKIYREDLSRQ